MNVNPEIDRRKLLENMFKVAAASAADVFSIRSSQASVPKTEKDKLPHLDLVETLDKIISEVSQLNELHKETEKEYEKCLELFQKLETDVNDRGHKNITGDNLTNFEKQVSLFKEKLDTFSIFVNKEILEKLRQEIEKFFNDFESEINSMVLQHELLEKMFSGTSFSSFEDMARKINESERLFLSQLERMKIYLNQHH